MKVLIVLSALALAVFAAEEKTQEKRGLLGLGYGYHDALAAPVAYAAPAYAAPVAKLGYGLGLGYAGYAAPAIAPIAKLGYAAAPVAYAAAPVAKLGYAGYGYAPAAYGGYAPAAYGGYGYAAPALAAPIAKVGYAGIGGYGAFDLGYGHGLYH